MKYKIDNITIKKISSSIVIEKIPKFTEICKKTPFYQELNDKKRKKMFRK